MPRTKPKRALLNVPFAKGLAQMTDPRLAELGTAQAATNYVADKAGRMAKAPGFTSAALANLSVGKSVAQNRGNLLAIGSVAGANGCSQDLLIASGNTTGVINGPHITIGQLPETRAGTPFVVSSGDRTYAGGDMGVYVTSPPAAYVSRELYVFEAAGQIYASIYNVDANGYRFCLSQAAVLPPFSALTTTQHAGKVTVCGSLAVVTAMAVDPTATAFPIIIATTIDLSAATFTAGSWTVATTIATTSLSKTTTVYPYGVAHVDDDPARYLLIYQGLVLEAPAIWVERVLASNNSITTSGTFTDTTWVSNGRPVLSGFAIRGDTNGAYFAYGYNNADYFIQGGGDGDRLLIAGTPSVYGGGLAMPGLGSSICSPINLCGGSSTYAMPPAPQLLDIKLVPDTSNPALQQVVWSPGPEPSVLVSAGPVYSQGPGTGIPLGLNRLGNTPPNFPTSPTTPPQAGCPYAAIYQSVFYTTGGTGTYGANSFRWTNGAVLASKMALVSDQTNGIATENYYVVGYMPSHNPNATVPEFGAPSTPGFPTTGKITTPGSGLQINIAGVYPAQATNDSTYYDAVSSASTAAPHIYENIQGSFFLFSIDTFGNLSTPQATYNGNNTPVFVGTNVPMRWVCSMAPRQALSQISITSFVLPHLVGSTPNAGASLETILPLSTSASQAAMAVMPVNLAYGQQYQSAELGGLTGLACGVPALTDGQNIEEFAYPYYPESIQADIAYNGAGSTGAILSGTYQFMATYERIDSTGAKHTSGRSVPVTVIVPTITTASLLGNSGFPTTPLGVPISNGNETFVFFTTGAGIFAPEMASGGGVLIINAVISGVTTPFAYPIVGFVSSQAIIINVGSNTFPVSLWSSGWTAAVQSITYPMVAQITLHVPNMGYSLSSGTVIALYRTTNDGTTFYFDQSVPNSVTSSYTDITDITYDGDLGLVSSGLFWSDYNNSPPAIQLTVPAIPATPGISTNPEIYGDGNSSTTPGAILDNLTPPSFDGLVTHKNRWWGFQGPNVWYSKALTNGEGPGFNEEQALSIDDGPGPVTALASQDERLIAWKSDRLFYISGDGPDDSGSNNDLQPPQRIVSDSGCINSLSVITGPMGTWFQGTNGLYLLNRKMMVEPAGKNVEDALATYPIITGSALDVPNGRILWSAVPALGSPGIIIQYDYVLDVWSTRSLNNGATFPSPCGVAALPTGVNGSSSALICSQDASTGTLYIESPGALSVNGSYLSGTWQSPQIKAQDLQGFAHWWMVNLMWANNDPHQITIQIAYDYATTATDSYIVTAAEMAAATTPQMQWRFQPSQPKAQAIQVTIIDNRDQVTAPVTFAGPTLLSLVIEYGLKDSRARVPVAQRN